jgi:hypothetical protein
MKAAGFWICGCRRPPTAPTSDPSSPRAALSTSLRAERSHPCRGLRSDGLLRRFAPRNDAEASDSIFKQRRGCESAFSWRDPPEGLRQLRSLPKKQRAQGRPGARCTRGLVCKVHKEMRTRAYRFSGGNPAFPARWFTAYFVLSPVTGFVATVIPEKLASHELDASIGAPGPHDFAVRISHARQSQLSRPPHLAARS